MGADINAKDDEERTPLKIAIIDEARKKMWFKSYNGTIQLLIDRGADVVTKIASWQTSENINELFAAPLYPPQAYARQSDY